MDRSAKANQALIDVANRCKTEGLPNLVALVIGLPYEVAVACGMGDWSPERLEQEQQAVRKAAEEGLYDE